MNTDSIDMQALDSGYEVLYMLLSFEDLVSEIKYLGLGHSPIS